MIFKIFLRKKNVKIYRNSWMYLDETPGPTIFQRRVQLKWWLPIGFHQCYSFHIEKMQAFNVGCWSFEYKHTSCYELLRMYDSSITTEHEQINSAIKGFSTSVLGVGVFMSQWQLDLQLPVQLVPITTKVVSLNPAHGEVYSIQLYVIKFVNDLSVDFSGY